MFTDFLKWGDVWLRLKAHGSDQGQWQKVGDVFCGLQSILHKNLYTAIFCMATKLCILCVLDYYFA